LDDMFYITQLRRQSKFPQMKKSSLTSLGWFMCLSFLAEIFRVL